MPAYRATASRSCSLSGERPIGDAGAIRIDDTPVGTLDAAQRRELGLAFVPEDRLGRGAVPDMSLAENALLTAHREGMVRNGFVRRAAVDAYARDTIAAFGVKAGGPQAAARSLSGGNLQKYIVGREIRQQPKLLIAAQPTWVWTSAPPRRSGSRCWTCAIRASRCSSSPRSSTSCSRSAIGSRSSPRPAFRSEPVADTNAEAIGLMMSGGFVAAGARPLPKASPAGTVQ